MLVLLSFALVLAATVLLVLGLLNDDGLALIYISIGSSVAAAIVLMIALRRNRPKAEAKPSPSPLPSPTRAEPVADPEPATVEATEEGEWLASDWEEGAEVEFPIADYDDLTAGQILPLLPQLYADEIDVVEARERSTKSRPEILDRLAELRRDPSTESVSAAPAPAEPEAAALAETDWDGDGEWFPIEDYESLSAAQIRPLLGELDADELGLVRSRELALGRRRSLLDDIDRRLGTAAPTTAPVASVAPAGRATTTTTPPAKRAAPTKRAAPAKKATPAKKAAPAKKATPAKRAAPAKRPAPAKKASPIEKAPTRKAAAAKKAPTKKAAAAKQVPAKKVPAKKVPTKKAPAKRATRRT